ncbi:MAG: glycosyltransferase [Candidatus Paceibacterota bacterium]
MFDKNYLYKGLTLYFSLEKNCPDFNLWVLCMDSETLELLRKMNLSKIKLITLEEFENEKLKKIKNQRTASEYSWTCAANLCWFMLDKINDQDLITYLDADLYFFSNPQDIFNEIKNSSIAIIEHKLKGSKLELEKYVGKYNVGWVSFRKDKEGIKASEWWKDRVLEWCFAYFKNGMIGDQHYLNDWTERFENVCVIKNEGADIAPWNVNNLRITFKNEKVFVGNSPLIFYHFHNFSLINKNSYIPVTAYNIPNTAKIYIYNKYFKEMKKTIEFVSGFDQNFNSGFRDKFIKAYIARILFRSRLFEYLYIRYSCYKLKKTASTI